MDSGEGFVGCISRVTFNDYFPLQRLFQEDRKSNVRAFPSNMEVFEDKCGIEPATHPPGMSIEYSNLKVYKLTILCFILDY